MPAIKKERTESSLRTQRPCQLCVAKSGPVDFKDTQALRRFLSEQGKIVGRRISGNCAVHQREITLAIKRSREIGLIGII